MEDISETLGTFFRESEEGRNATTEFARAVVKGDSGDREKKLFTATRAFYAFCEDGGMRENWTAVMSAIKDPQTGTALLERIAESDLTAN